MDDLITRYCFGEVWDRPPLSRKIRSMLTLAILSGSTRPTQLKVHVRGAIQNGVSKEEIREVLLHSMLYVGIPAGVDSYMQAAEALKELGLE
jgi:4-carboxymuconolactone decarboxylase